MLKHHKVCEEVVFQKNKPPFTSRPYILLVFGWFWIVFVAMGVANPTLRFILTL
jgi:hypothetical protein